MTIRTERKAVAALIAGALLVAASSNAMDISPYEVNAVCPADAQAALGMDFATLREACFPSSSKADLDCGQIRMAASRTGDAEWPEGDVAEAALRNWCMVSGDRAWPHGMRNVGEAPTLSTTFRIAFDGGKEGCGGTAHATADAGILSFDVGGVRWKGRLSPGDWVTARPDDGNGAAFGARSEFYLMDPVCGKGTAVPAVRSAG